jgi:pSer/pThr/pTyr-binding forkhead associated (FHA) protein
VRENQVDINLASSTYASMVDVEHAVLNYTGGSWYVEDLASKNGISVQSSKDGRKYKLAPDQPCKLDAGDIIYIGLARLLIR